MKTYSELIQYNRYEDRLKYLELKGHVGIETFGFDRYLNQAFYNCEEWKSARDFVIVRDEGCDLGIEGMYIYDKIIIHHMNPITERDILDRNPDIFNPEYLICTSHRTHNGIHYGIDSLLLPIYVERKPNDQIFWR